MVDKLPKMHYKAGEKIPMTKDMLIFLHQLLAKERGLKVLEIKYREKGSHDEYQILYP